MWCRELDRFPRDRLAVAGNDSIDGIFAGRSRAEGAVLPGLDRGLDKHDPNQPVTFASSAKYRPVRVCLTTAIRGDAGLDEYDVDHLRRLAYFVPAKGVAPSDGQIQTRRRTRFLAVSHLRRMLHLFALRPGLFRATSVQTRRRTRFLAVSHLRPALYLFSLPPGFFRATLVADGVARRRRNLNRRGRKSGGLTRGGRRVGSALGLAKLRVKAIGSATAQVQASAH